MTFFTFTLITFVTLPVFSNQTHFQKVDVQHINCTKTVSPQNFIMEKKSEKVWGPEISECTISTSTLIKCTGQAQGLLQISSACEHHTVYCFPVGLHVCFSGIIASPSEGDSDIDSLKCSMTHPTNTYISFSLPESSWQTALSDVQCSPKGTASRRPKADLCAPSLRPPPYLGHDTDAPRHLRHWLLAWEMVPQQHTTNAACKTSKC